MKKKENYLERKPQRCDDISWSKEGEIVTLAIENKGFMNRVFQKLLKNASACLRQNLKHPAANNLKR